MVTQPLMYKRVAAHPGTRKLYADRLVLQGVVKPEEPDQMIKDFRTALDEGRVVESPVLSDYKRKYAVDWTPFLNKDYTDVCNTKVPAADIKRLIESVTRIPADFTLHSRVQKIIDDRKAMGSGTHSCRYWVRVIFRVWSSSARMPT